MVIFYDQTQSSQEQNGNYQIFQQRKNKTNKYHSKNQPHHYPQNYSPSDDEKYYKQNHQRFSSNQRPCSHRIDQPDIFDPYTRTEQEGQPKYKPTSYNNNFQQ